MTADDTKMLEILVTTIQTVGRVWEQKCSQTDLLRETLANRDKYSQQEIDKVLRVTDRPIVLDTVKRMEMEVMIEREVERRMQNPGAAGNTNGTDPHVESKRESDGVAAPDSGLAG